MTVTWQKSKEWLAVQRSDKYLDTTEEESANDVYSFERKSFPNLKEKRRKNTENENNTTNEFDMDSVTGRLLNM